jgi:chromate reductase, NAD(P)H dehydrogenase (quinone)
MTRMPERNSRPGRMNQTREPVGFVVFSASLRAGSLNGRLAQLSADAIAANGGEVDLAAMDAFDAPSYEADMEEVEMIITMTRGSDG